MCSKEYPVGDHSPGSRRARVLGSTPIAETSPRRQERLCVGVCKGCCQMIKAGGGTGDSPSAAPPTALADPAEGL
jgi:hypothetical protein